jgi:hypothetical protein
VRVDGINHAISLSVDPPATGSLYARSIKGALIKDPDGSFWVGPRKRTKLTLGELVSFSLWFLLGEAYDNLFKTIGRDPDKVDVRFSLPNWVDIDEGSVGRACYEQAARVAGNIFASDRQAWSRISCPDRQHWQDNVQHALAELKISDETEISRDRQGFRLMLQRTFNVCDGLEFRFVAESSAAGLAGLRNEEMELEIENNKYLRKILVVDVGAGSTDIGYVIRSMPAKDTEGKEALCQLPPANTCQIAGADLSRRIVEVYRSRGEDIGFDEAETRKTIGEDNDWLEHPSVEEWRHSIAENVKSYISGVPDKLWLPEKPGLQILITGGSGVVGGLREEILYAAKEGLNRRGIRIDVRDASALMSLNLEGPAARDSNRLAVALGAASEDLPRLSYFQKLDPPMPVTSVRMPQSWTGS